MPGPISPNVADGFKLSVHSRMPALSLSRVDRGRHRELGLGDRRLRQLELQAHRLIQPQFAESKCMRAHGVPNFPDPTFGHGGDVGVILGSGENPDSPAIQNALKAYARVGTPIPGSSRVTNHACSRCSRRSDRARPTATDSGRDPHQQSL
jgi:hypothetical protein